MDAAFALAGAAVAALALGASSSSSSLDVVVVLALAASWLLPRLPNGPPATSLTGQTERPSNLWYVVRWRGLKIFNTAILSCAVSFSCCDWNWSIWALTSGFSNAFRMASGSKFRRPPRPPWPF